MSQVLQLRHAPERNRIEAAPAAKPAAVRERQFYFVLLPNFTMIAFAMAIEPLRIANRMAGKQAYRWSLISLDGLAAAASNGIRLNVDVARMLARVRGVSGIMFYLRPLMSAFMTATSTPDRLARPPKIGIGALDRRLRWRTPISDATLRHPLGSSRVLQRLPRRKSADLFEVDGNCYTCAGAPLHST